MSLFSRLTGALNNVSRVVQTANNFNSALTSTVRNVATIGNNLSNIAQVTSNKADALNRAGKTNLNQARILGKCAYQNILVGILKTPQGRVRVVFSPGTSDLVLSGSLNYEFDTNSTEHGQEPSRSSK